MHTENKIDVLVVGELNVDLILNGIGALPAIGKEILASGMTLTLGSSSAIFASNLSSLGSKVSFAGKIGNDLFGNLVLESLHEKGVNTDLIHQSDDLHTGATVVLNYQENRAMITHPGAMEHLQSHEIPKEKIVSAKHLHLSSYFLQKGMIKNMASFFREAKQCGLTTSLDPQWDPEEKWEMNLQELLPWVDVFLPNEEELLNLTRQPTVEAALDMLSAFANCVVVKLGNRGSLYVNRGERKLLPAFHNRSVVDAIGAGDSFNAGFIHQFIQGAEPGVCQRFGNLVAAISTTAAGGTGAFRDIHHKIQNAGNLYGFR
ncbi:MAG: carbohydrate kinase family protein [Puia sp.]